MCLNSLLLSTKMHQSKLLICPNLIFFPVIMCLKSCHTITSTMGVLEWIGTRKYLGAPSMVGTNKWVVFGYIRDRVWKKIQSWEGRWLSKAGKEVMIKFVLKAIPNYCMSMFLLPHSLIEEIHKMLNAFWWSSEKGARRGFHWFCWEKLAMRKDQGGMGS